MDLKIICKSIITVFLTSLVLSFLLMCLSEPVSAQNDFTVTIGQDKVFTTYNVHNTDLQTPANNISQGPPSILDASSEGEKASVHVLAEAFQTGSASAWLGMIFSVQESPVGTKQKAEISIAINYRLDVDFNVPDPILLQDGGGSADALVFGIDTHIDRIYFINHSDSDEKSAIKVLKSNILLEAGKTYEAVVEVFAHCDVYNAGYADSYAEVVIQEIKITFYDETHLSLILLIAGGTTVLGGAVAYQAFYRGKPSSSDKIESDLKRKRSRQKKKEKKEEERRKSKKRKPNLVWSVDVPKKITGSRPSQAVINIQNSGQAPANDILISVSSKMGVILEKRIQKIPLLKPKDRKRLIFRFKIDEKAKKGIYTLNFNAESKQTPTQVKRRYIRAFKIGIITGPQKTKYAESLKNWLRKNSYAWNELVNAEDYLELLRYDLLIIGPELQVAPRGMRNLSNFVENSQSLIVFDKIITSEQEIVARTLGYNTMQYKQFKAIDAALTIVNNKHTITKGFAMGQRKSIGPIRGNACVSKIDTGQILAVQEIQGEKENRTITVPAITINNYGKGKTFHLNFDPESSLPQLNDISKSAINWLLS